MTGRLAKALALATLCALAAQQVAAANLYRWKNSEGNMVISDRPPPGGVAFETIATDSSVVRRVDGEAPPAQVVPAARPEPQAKSPEPAPEKTIYKKNPDYCTSARNNLEILARPRIRIIGEDGEARFLTAEEREEQIEQARELVAQNC